MTEQEIKDDLIELIGLLDQLIEDFPDVNSNDVKRVKFLTKKLGPNLYKK